MRTAPLVLLLLLLGAASQAEAQGGAAPGPAQPSTGTSTAGQGPAAAAGRPVIDPAQARQVLDTLRDDRRRAEFLGTLEGILRVQEAARPATAASVRPGTVGASGGATGGAAANSAPGAGNGPAAGTAPGTAARAPEAAPATTAVAEAAASPPAGANPAEAAASAGPLAPDSLGAQLLVRVSAAVSAGAAKIAATVNAVNDLPLLWRWLTTLVTDPVGRAKLADAGWKMLACVGIAILAEQLVARLLRRFRNTLARLAPDSHASDLAHGHGDPSEAEEALAAAEAGEVEHSRRRHRLTLALRALRRLPYVLGALLLDLVPLVVFAAVGNALLGTGLGQPPTTRLLILAVVNAYVLCRVVLAVVRLLVSPDRPSLRLLALSDAGARFVTRWARRLVITGVAGYALAEVGLLFGLYRAAHDSLLKLVALAVHASLIVMVLQARGAVSRRLRAPVPSSGPVAVLRNRLAEIWHIPTVLLIGALWLVWAVELRDGYARLLHFALVTAVVLVAARLVGIVALGALDRLFRIGAPTGAAGVGARLGFYYPAVRLAASVVLWALTGLALAQTWGLPVLYFLTQDWLGRRTVSALLLIGLTVLLAVMAWEGANAAIEGYLARLTAEAQAMRAARLRTLLPMLRTALLVSILVVVALTVLSELGVNIAPLLAGAGVVGIAVGFGSQKLVQDLITGLFLLLENAMQVGDVVTLGGLSGTVEALSIRTIRLRALDGSIHIIPFSAVTTVTNQTRDYGYAVLDVNVGFDEEPDRVGEVLRGVAAEMAQEESWSPLLTGDLEVMGVERFTDTAWVMRARIKTLPGSRWKVARELNRRIKNRFDELAIESPFTSHKVLGRTPPAPPVPPKPTEEPAAAAAA